MCVWQRRLQECRTTPMTHYGLRCDDDREGEIGHVARLPSSLVLLSQLVATVKRPAMPSK